MARLLALDDWGAFGGGQHDENASHPGQLEGYAHDGIHGYIGKDNRNTVLAVRDPVFWAHHAMLDKLIATWQRAHPGSTQCFDCSAIAYKDATLGNLTVNQLLSNDHLPVPGGGTVAVVYLEKGAQPPPQAFALASPPRPPLVMAPAPSPVATLAPPHAMTMSPGPRPASASPPREIVAFVFRVPPVEGNRFALRINDLAAPTDETYRIGVYLHPQSVTFAPTAAFAAKYRAGSITQFAYDMGALDRGHPKTAQLTFDLTPAVRKFGLVAGENWQLTLVFAPADPGLTYAQVAREIGYSTIELLRSDPATIQSLPLNPVRIIR